MRIIHLKHDLPDATDQIAVLHTVNVFHDAP
jgi:hypothetical protein